MRQGLRVKSEGQSHVHGMGLKPSSEEIMEIDLLSDDDDAPGRPGQGLTQASHQQEQRQLALMPATTVLDPERVRARSTSPRGRRGLEAAEEAKRAAEE